MNQKGMSRFTKAERIEFARRGGLAVSQDRRRMAEMGRLGGMKISQDREHMSRIGKLGGLASRERNRIRREVSK